VYTGKYVIVSGKYVIFVYLISELFGSVRKICSCSIVRYTNRIGSIAKWTSRR